MCFIALYENAANYKVEVHVNQYESLDPRPSFIFCYDGHTLFFRRGNGDKRNHFVHIGLDERKCEITDRLNQKYKGGESEEHFDAKHNVKGVSLFTVPNCDTCQIGREHIIVDPTWIFKNEYILDRWTCDAVFLDMEGNVKFVVEVYCKHKTTGDKLEWLLQQPFRYVEVDTRLKVIEYNHKKTCTSCIDKLELKKLTKQSMKRLRELTYSMQFKHTEHYIKIFWRLSEINRGIDTYQMILVGAYRQTVLRSVFTKKLAEQDRIKIHEQNCGSTLEKLQEMDVSPQAFWKSTVNNEQTMRDMVSKIPSNTKSANYDKIMYVLTFHPNAQKKIKPRSQISRTGTMLLLHDENGVQYDNIGWLKCF